MPRGNRVKMLSDLHREDITEEDGTIRATGYNVGGVYNFPTHLARALVNKGLAEFCHASNKVE